MGNKFERVDERRTMQWWMQQRKCQCEDELWFIIADERIFEEFEYEVVD